MVNFIMPTPPPQYPPSTPSRPQPSMPRPVQFIDDSTARALAALSHGAIAFGFLGIGFLVSLAISGVIWLYGRRSPLVRYHSEQAGCYQCSVLLITLLLLVLAGASGGFSLFNVLQGRGDWGAGWLFWALLVLFLVWWVGTISLGIVGAVMVLMGKSFKYPFIGDRIRKTKF